jgi:hypothetical protein
MRSEKIIRIMHILGHDFIFLETNREHDEFGTGWYRCSRCNLLMLKIMEQYIVADKFHIMNVALKLTCNEVIIKNLLE